MPAEAACVLGMTGTDITRTDRAPGVLAFIGAIKDFAFLVGKILGAIDLEEAANVLQNELRRFATEQLAPDSQVHALLIDGLAAIEHRLNVQCSNVLRTTRAPRIVRRLNAFSTNSSVPSNGWGVFTGTSCCDFSRRILR